jgi:hypothetical protein
MDPSPADSAAITHVLQQIEDVLEHIVTMGQESTVSEH